MSTGSSRPPPCGIFAENAQHAVLGMIDDLDDAAAMANAVVFVGFFDAEQHAVADTGSFAGSRFAWSGDTDFGRGAVCVLVPFVRRGDEIAVAVARGHIREHGRGQGARHDAASCAAFSTEPSSANSRSRRLRSARSAFFSPNARAISRVPTFPGLIADEGEYVGLGREGWVFVWIAYSK